MITAVLGFGICLHGSYAHPVAAFYLLRSRLWELLMGASLAAHLIRRDGSGNLVRGGVAPPRLLGDGVDWADFGHRVLLR